MGTIGTRASETAAGILGTIEDPFAPYIWLSLLDAQPSSAGLSGLLGSVSGGVRFCDIAWIWNIRNLAIR